MTSSTSDHRKRAWVGAGVAFGLLAVLTHGQVFRAGNDASRWAQVEAIVDYGEPSIDRSQFAWTIDRVTLDGHLYSNKPPVLSLAAAGTYWLVRWVTGGSLADPVARQRLVYLVTLLLVGGSAAWLVGEMSRALARRPDVGAEEASLVLAATACGTTLTSFATTLNNHTVAAALLFAAWHAAWRGEGGRAGLWGGLAACVDIVPGAGMLPFLALSLRRRHRGTIRRFAVSVAACAALGVLADFLIVGHPWPPKLVPRAVDASAEIAPSVAGVVLPQGWTYPLEALFGWRGFFSLSPVLLFGAAGLGLVAWGRRESPGSRPVPRPEAIDARWLACGIAVQIVFHVLFAGSFGGWSYGFRYLIPIAPLLLYFAPAVMRGAGRTGFVAALAPSVLVALLGAYNPWPPVFEQESSRHEVAARVTNPVAANAAAFLTQYFPGSPLAERAASSWVSEDRAERQRWLAYFFWSKGDLETLRRIER